VASFIIFLNKCGVPIFAFKIISPLFSDCALIPKEKIKSCKQKFIIGFGHI